MTGDPTERGTIFTLERKALWLSDMQRMTNRVRIWGIITDVEGSRDWAIFLNVHECPSQPH